MAQLSGAASPSVLEPELTPTHCACAGGAAEGMLCEEIDDIALGRDLHCVCVRWIRGKHAILG